MSHLACNPYYRQIFPFIKIIGFILLFGSLWSFYLPVSWAVTFTVNTLVDTEDATPGDGVAQDVNGETSLRAAITEASALAGADDIVFASTLVANGDTEIELTLFDTGLDNAELGPSAFIVDSTITITGPSGDGGITIKRSGNNDFRFFHITSSGDLTLENLTFSDGVAQGGSGSSSVGAGGGGSAGIGGAIVNQGSLALIASTLTNNQALGGFGGRGCGAILCRGGGGGGGVGGNGANGGNEDSAGRSAGGAGGGPNGGAGGRIDPKIDYRFQSVCGTAV